MSLLVDLLSKTKTKDLRKEIPPDLRKTVINGANKRKTRRKVIFLSTLVLVVFLAGFGTIYVMDIFKSSLSVSIAAKTDARLPPQSPVASDNKPRNPFDEVKEPVQHVTAVPKILLPHTGSQEKLTPAMDSFPKVAEKHTREGQPVIQAMAKTQAPVGLKLSSVETQSAEKGEGKTNKDVFLLAARTHEGKGELRQAIDCYMKALELDPANYVVMNNIAGIYIRLKLFDESLSYANKALGIKMNYIPSLINAGIAHISLGNLFEGESLLVRATALDTLNKVVLFNLAVLYEKQGNYGKAFENYYKLSQMRDADGCLGAARILERQGHYSETARFYRDILSIETASPSARELANQRLTQLSKQ